MIFKDSTEQPHNNVAVTDSRLRQARCNACKRPIASCNCANATKQIPTPIGVVRSKRRSCSATSPGHPSPPGPAPTAAEASTPSAASVLPREHLEGPAAWSDRVYDPRLADRLSALRDRW